MKTLASTAAAVLAMGSASLAAWQPARGSDEVKLDIIAALQGRCTAMIVAGKPAACAQRGGVLVTRLKNQRTLVMIGMADGKSALTFVGEGAQSDAAPLADLPISRVYVGSDPNAPHVDAKGSCKLEPGAAGKLACQAVDAAGARYNLEFQGSAAPEIQRF
ncbi:hypothetical protein GCM10007036_33980 [Alsobacter metallidurans]|uniref:Uncharacterized protein n=1 Tax=Alsobacter metallidurans TaxID=340221 RepID=A0A917I8M6_9HYPH|nr:hypothetical protein [Alsobacter metallidurans]GGH26299.1 hypothetical protein GCM10007036_33980 [Alsobacter metallidurans]